MSGIRERILKVFAVLCLVILVGCETYGGGDWKSRIGSYTMDDAIKELGPPDTKATTTDGITVGQWLVARSRVYATGGRGYGYGYGYGFWGGSWGNDITSSPDAYLQLSFGTDGKLASWKKVYK